MENRFFLILSIVNSFFHPLRRREEGSATRRRIVDRKRERLYPLLEVR